MCWKSDKAITRTNWGWVSAHPQHYMRNRDKLIIGIILLTGVFTYKLLALSNILGFEVLNNLVGERFAGAQHSFFVLSVLLLGSYLLYTKNKYVGVLGAVCSLAFFKTYLCQHAPMEEMLTLTLGGSLIFALYYIFRTMDIKENLLKWLLIPASLNALLLIVQKFDHNFLVFMPVEGMTGFLGNASVSGCFVALCIPVYLKYWRKGLWLVIPAILLSKSLVACGAALMASLVYLNFSDRKQYRFLMMIVIMGILLFAIHLTMFENGIVTLKGDALQRASMWVGTLDGIKQNPILGWGVGSFEPVMRKIPQLESIYLGRSFNYNLTPGLEAIMNHPHNEFLFNWWNVGIGYILVMILLIKNLLRKFTEKKVLPFSILVAGFIIMLGYFLSYPAWFVLMLALAIYEGGKDGDTKKGIQYISKGSKSTKGRKKSSGLNGR